MSTRKVLKISENLLTFVSWTDGYQATDVYYKWNSRNSTGDVVYIAEDLEMPQFMITKVELEERTNIYNIGMLSFGVERSLMNIQQLWKNFALPAWRYLEWLMLLYCFRASLGASRKIHVSSSPWLLHDPNIHPVDVNSNNILVLILDFARFSTSPRRTWYHNSVDNDHDFKQCACAAS